MYFQRDNRNLLWPLLLLTILLPSEVIFTTGNSFVSALQIDIQSNANPNLNVWGYWCFAFPSQLHMDSYTALLFPIVTILHFLCLEKNVLCSSDATVFPCRKDSISKAGEAFLLLSRVEILCGHVFLGGESCKTSGKTCHLTCENFLVHRLWLWVHYKTILSLITRPLRAEHCNLWSTLDPSCLTSLNDLEEAKEHTLTKFAYDTKLGGTQLIHLTAGLLFREL